MNLELHPLCTLFPRITGNEFESLKTDIASNGLRNPIVLHDGFILDGGNRYRACMEIGIIPETIEYDGGNLVSYVLSVNMHRRHLSAGQQAAIVASAQDWGSAQTHGGGRKTDQGATLHLETTADRAAQSGASLRTQKMADAVAKQSPELAKQVAHGEISLPKAHEQIAPKAQKIDATITSDELLDLREQLLEVSDLLKSTLSDNEMMGRVFDSDDRIKAAMDEAKRQKAIADNAERTLTAKNGEYIARASQVTHWQNRAVKAEKELAKIKAAL